MIQLAEQSGGRGSAGGAVRLATFIPGLESEPDVFAGCSLSIILIGDEDFVEVSGTAPPGHAVEPQPLARGEASRTGRTMTSAEQNAN